MYSILFHRYYSILFYCTYFMPTILFRLQLLLSIYFILIISWPLFHLVYSHWYIYILFKLFQFRSLLKEPEPERNCLASDCCCNCCAYDNKPSWTLNLPWCPAPTSGLEGLEGKASLSTRAVALTACASSCSTSLWLLAASRILRKVVTETTLSGF